MSNTNRTTPFILPAVFHRMKPTHPPTPRKPLPLHPPTPPHRRGAKVISASWGGAYTKPIALKNAIQAFANQGGLFVAAAMNFGIDLDATPMYPPSLKLPNMIVVGAVDEQRIQASYSNWGRYGMLYHLTYTPDIHIHVPPTPPPPILPLHTYSRSIHTPPTHRTTVDVFAPGSNILSTVPRSSCSGQANGCYGIKSGTSMAAPLVAGQALLLMVWWWCGGGVVVVCVVVCVCVF